MSTAPVGAPAPWLAAAHRVSGLVPGRMALVLHQSGVSHGHGGHCNHGNASVRAAFIHVLGDLVQSVGVLLAAAIIHFWVGGGGVRGGG